MPALIEPSPITATTLLSRPSWSRAAQKPRAAEIEVAAWAAPNGSYSLSVRLVKPDRPVLVHVVTQKGKGYAPAENAADKHHAVAKFDVVTGQQAKPAQTHAPSYTKVFAEELIKRAERDPKIVAITAAMPSGTGLDLFGQRFPERMFDVGIAEQHG